MQETNTRAGARAQEATPRFTTKKVEAMRAEIERRYDQKKPERTLWLNRIAVKRIRDIELYLEGRYGRVLPDDDAGRQDLVILLNHLAQNPIDPQAKMRAAIHCWAAWMDHDERQDLIERIAGKPRWYKAKTLGRLMRITKEEHARWGLESIWAFTTTEDDMKKKKQRRDRKAVTAKRRSDGVVPRAEYLAKCKSQTELWKPLNMSRSTYYRKLKAGQIPSETSVSSLLERDSYRSDTPVSPSAFCPHFRSYSPTCSMPIRDRGVAIAKPKVPAAESR